MAVRSLVAGAAALVLVAATVMAGKSYLESAAAQATTNAAPARHTAILTVTRDLVAGTRIAEGDVAWRAWPQSGVAAGQIIEGRLPLAHFHGQVVRTNMLAGEPVTPARVIAPDDRSTLAAVTGQGLRAVSIALNATSGVSGLVAPGDRVDVLVSYVVPGSSSSDGGSRDSKAVATVLRDVRVVAVDQVIATVGAIANIHNATLEVTPQQAELLTLASDIGKLTLSLRSVRRPDEAELASMKPIIDSQIGLLLPGRRMATGRRIVPNGTPAVATAMPTAAPRSALIELRGNSGAAPATGTN